MEESAANLRCHFLNGEFFLLVEKVDSNTVESIVNEETTHGVVCHLVEHYVLHITA